MQWVDSIDAEPTVWRTDCDSKDNMKRIGRLKFFPT